MECRNVWRAALRAPKCFFSKQGQVSSCVLATLSVNRRRPIPLQNSENKLGNGELVWRYYYNFKFTYTHEYDQLVQYAGVLVPSWIIGVLPYRLKGLGVGFAFRECRIAVRIDLP